MGKYRRFPFRKQALIKDKGKVGGRHCLSACTRVPFFLLPPGLLMFRTTKAAAAQTSWTIIHGQQCALPHQPVTYVYKCVLSLREGVLSLKTWDTLFFIFHFKKKCCLQTTYVELITV